MEAAAALHQMHWYSLKLPWSQEHVFLLNPTVLIFELRSVEWWMCRGLDAESLVFTCIAERVSFLVVHIEKQIFGACLYDFVWFMASHMVQKPFLTTGMMRCQRSRCTLKIVLCRLNIQFRLLREFLLKSQENKTLKISLVPGLSLVVLRYRPEKHSLNPNYLLLYAIKIYSNTWYYSALRFTPVDAENMKVTQTWGASFCCLTSSETCVYLLGSEVRKPQPGSDRLSAQEWLWYWLWAAHCESEGSRWILELWKEGRTFLWLPHFPFFAVTFQVIVFLLWNVATKGPCFIFPALTGWQQILARQVKALSFLWDSVLALAIKWILRIFL